MILEGPFRLRRFCYSMSLTRNSPKPDVPAIHISLHPDLLRQAHLCADNFQFLQQEHSPTAGSSYLMHYTCYSLIFYSVVNTGKKKAQRKPLPTCNCKNMSALPCCCALNSILELIRGLIFLISNYF